MMNLAFGFRWSMKALSGRVRLGKVVMRAGEPVALEPDGDVRAAVLEVRYCHSLHAVHGLPNRCIDPVELFSHSS